MNNLFNSSVLFIELKKQEFETADIVRSDKTEREKIEESQSTSAQKQTMKKEKNRDFQSCLTELKQKYVYQLK